jgi:hypothetical protein
MKKVLLSVVLSLIAVMILSGCAGDTSQTVPAGYLPSLIVTEAPDDIVITPGGNAYRANVHREGVPDIWPPVETVYITLDDLNIRYRADIETRAGEIRNNIITVIKEGGLIDSKLKLYSREVPEGMQLTDAGGAGLPRTLVSIMRIAVSSGVTPGQYAFQIGIEIDGKDYGTIPCKVNVVE